MTRLGAAMMLTLALLGGCGERSPEPAARMEPAVRETVSDESGVLQVAVSLDRAKATMIDRFTLRIEAKPSADAPGAVVEPELGEALPLALKAGRTRDVSTGDRSSYAWEIPVEPLEPGTHEIGPIEVLLTRAGAEGGETVASVRTPALRVEVEALLSEAELEEGLAAMKEVVEPAEGPAWRAWAIGGAVALAALGAGAWLLARRGREAEAEVVRRAAHELAFERLERLRGSGLLQRGAWKAYYADLSLILRRYIEDRFGLHAPERTTEEFLAESKASAAFTEADVALLEKFLHHCDMVKFAAVEPTVSQGELAADSVRSFVERTRSESSLVVVSGPGGPGTGVAA